MRQSKSGKSHLASQSCGSLVRQWNCENLPIKYSYRLDFKEVCPQGPSHVGWFICALCPIWCSREHSSLLSGECVFPKNASVNLGPISQWSLTAMGTIFVYLLLHTGPACLSGRGHQSVLSQTVLAVGESLRPHCEGISRCAGWGWVGRQSLSGCLTR